MALFRTHDLQKDGMVILFLRCFRKEGFRKLHFLKDGVQTVVWQLDSYDIFCRDGANIEDLIDEDKSEFETSVCDSQHLLSLATKDVASGDVVSDLKGAKEKGIESVKHNTEERLVSKQIQFFGPMKKSKLKTFGSLYQISVKSKETSNIVKT